MRSLNASVAPPKVSVNQSVNVVDRGRRARRRASFSGNSARPRSRSATGRSRPGPRRRRPPARCGAACGLPPPPRADLLGALAGRGRGAVEHDRHDHDEHAGHERRRRRRRSGQRREHRLAETRAVDERRERGHRQRRHDRLVERRRRWSCAPSAAAPCSAAAERSGRRSRSPRWSSARPLRMPWPAIRMMRRQGVDAGCRPPRPRRRCRRTARSAAGRRRSASSAGCRGTCVTTASAVGLVPMPDRERHPDQHRDGRPRRT